MTPWHAARQSVALTLSILVIGATAAEAAPSITLCENGAPMATIVVGESPTPAANLAALELQHHVRRITGALLPIKTESEAVEGTRVLVGESAVTREMGLEGTDFAGQEYLIKFTPGTIVLMGRDWVDTPENRAEQGMGTDYMTLADWRQEIDYAAATGQEGSAQRMVLPGIYDDQGSCLAVYDFLERFCGVRWYGPSELNIVTPRTDTLVVSREDVRRSPGLKYRLGVGGGWPIVNAQWDKPSGDQLNLYWRRLRLGGEKWGGNHSFRSYRDRFLEKSPDQPGLFEEYHPEYFAQGWDDTQGDRQFCYTNKGLISQVARDARDYFDGKSLRGYQVAIGDYFAVIPLDNANWCKCDDCQAVLARDKDNIRGQHFNSGTATHYLFGFVDAVAREVAKTHPDKYIATLAYHVYGYPPEDFELSPNVSVGPCLQTRHQWAPLVTKNDLDFYKRWVDRADRPIHVWNYYCFPMEPAVINGWGCFPGFSAHTLADRIKMFHRDGVRGVFLCGIGEQVDYYLTMKMCDDPSIDPDALLDEFFRLYFGAAAEPMKAFYLRIESIYSDPENYPGEVREQERQFHQTETIAWECLGTEERMKELGTLIARAEELASGDTEKQRVRTWKEGVWDYMVKGRTTYLNKKSAN